MLQVFVRSWPKQNSNFCFPVNTLSRSQNYINNNLFKLDFLYSFLINELLTMTKILCKITFYKLTEELKNITSWQFTQTGISKWQYIVRPPVPFKKGVEGGWLTLSKIPRKGRGWKNCWRVGGFCWKGEKLYFSYLGCGKCNYCNF